MKRLPILLLLVPAWAAATTITGPSPVVSTACTLDGSPVACDSIEVTTLFTMTGLNTAAGLYIEAGAGVEAAGNSSAMASVSLEFYGDTHGPVREGFATYSIYTQWDADGGTTSRLIDSAFISTFGSCSQSICEINDVMVPFELGTPFEIGLKDSAAVGPGPFPNIVDGGSGYSAVTLRLFDASGAPVEIFAVPEPSVWNLAAIGLAAIFVFGATATLTGCKGNCKTAAFSQSD